jgi:hypothetical protein
MKMDFIYGMTQGFLAPPGYYYTEEAVKAREDTASRCFGSQTSKAAAIAAATVDKVPESFIMVLGFFLNWCYIMKITPKQPKFEFVCLEQLIPQNHLLRKALSPIWVGVIRISIFYYWCPNFYYVNREIKKAPFKNA